MFFNYYMAKNAPICYLIITSESRIVNRLVTNKYQLLNINNDIINKEENNTNKKVTIRKQDSVDS